MTITLQQLHEAVNTLAGAGKVAAARLKRDLSQPVQSHSYAREIGKHIRAYENATKVAETWLAESRQSIWGIVEIPLVVQPVTTESPTSRLSVKVEHSQVPDGVNLVIGTTEILIQDVDGRLQIEIWKYREEGSEAYPTIRYPVGEILSKAGDTHG